MSWSGLRVYRSRNAAGDLVLRFGVAVLDAYLEFLAMRSRPNTVAAVAYDLKVFFTAVGKPPRRVVAAEVLAFVTGQCAGGPARRVQVAGVGGVSARTVRRRLSSVSGLFAFLHARGDVAANPVPRGLPTRRERQRPRQGVPLVRTPRTLPRILTPGQVDALFGALRSYRDRAMAEVPPVCRRLGYLDGSGSGWMVAGFPFRYHASSYSSGERPPSPSWMRRGLYQP
jgi:site-specific recombinase XerC